MIITWMLSLLLFTLLLAAAAWCAEVALRSHRPLCLSGRRRDRLQRRHCTRP